MLLAGALAACTVGPDYERPDLAARTGAAWRQPSGAVVQYERSTLSQWWRQFGSPELAALAERLVGENLSLAAARERIVAAWARRGVVDADRLPRAAGFAGYTRAGTGDRGLNFQGPPAGRNVDVWSIGATAGWELDLWGRIARRNEAAEAEIEIAVEDYRGAAVSLLAELALAFVDASTLHDRLAVARRGIALQQETARLAQTKVDAGRGTRLDVDQAERELERSQAIVPALQLALATAENRVAVLVGERPADGVVLAGDRLELPPEIGLGVPADLLARRPDVRRSERRLAAATAYVGATEAERYPQITLDGTVALRAQQLSTLTSGAPALSYSFGPGLTIPLFTGGRIDAAVAAAESAVDLARVELERALLEAIAEVENAAEGVLRTRERHARLAASATAARRAVDFARSLYDSGRRDLLQVLDAERALVQIEDELLVARQAAFVQTIALYRALGGGFEAVGQDGLMAAEGSGQ
ncbi:MAG: efflux transporter outer membrane subunit [Planctomycetes bacterium]|nr:efflux transporter outer membrane subunit [Planctomycetota bacterium]